MARRKQYEPDKRLDWRDPNMPVMRMGNRRGEPKNAKTHMLVIKPKVMNELARWQMRHQEVFYPDWKNDPSYNWGKKRK